MCGYCVVGLLCYVFAVIGVAGFVGVSGCFFLLLNALLLVLMDVLLLLLFLRCCRCYHRC